MLEERQTFQRWARFLPQPVAKTKTWLPGNSVVTLTWLTRATPFPRATRNCALQRRDVYDPEVPNARSTPSTHIPIPALLVVVNNYKTSYLIFSGSWGNHFNIFVALLCNVHLFLVCRIFTVHSLIIKGEPMLNDFLKKEINLYVGKL